MSVQTLTVPPDRWAEVAANAIQARITARLHEVGHCAVMLTGGAQRGAVIHGLGATP